MNRARLDRGLSQAAARAGSLRVEDNPRSGSWEGQPRRLFWKSFSRLVPFACSLFLLTASLRAEHFNITLTVQSGTDRQEAYADDSPPPEGLRPRPVFRARAGTPLTWQFIMSNANPHDDFKQVTVRYFLVPERQVGQKELPALAVDPVLQGDFLLDFKLKGRVGLKQQFRIDRPGAYLLRVESANSHTDHEHFSAIDLDIR
ncbi:MAG: hypothetical protein KGS61_07695 [Verrucomicrobia bacterium]|nr:hypothetical protein [Verrucomicrobiota bacterium]